jgi:hypothetical protein
MAKDGTPKAEISVLADRWYITEKKSTAADGPSLDQDFPF